MQAFAENIRVVGGRIQRPTAVLDLAYDVSMPNPMQRKLITEAVAALPRKDLIAGHAVVSNSTVARGVLAVVNWFTKPTFPERVFGEPKEAVEWLVDLQPDVSPAAVLSDIRKRVPEFPSMQW